MDSLTLASRSRESAPQLGGVVPPTCFAVSLSTTDYVGHAYGPDSREIHDQVVRLDRYLGRFLEQLFVRYGKSNVCGAHRGPRRDPVSRALSRMGTRERCA